MFLKRPFKSLLLLIRAFILMLIDIEAYPISYSGTSMMQPANLEVQPTPDSGSSMIWRTDMDDRDSDSFASMIQPMELKANPNPDSESSMIWRTNVDAKDRDSFASMVTKEKPTNLEVKPIFVSGGSMIWQTDLDAKLTNESVTFMIQQTNITANYTRSNGTTMSTDSLTTPILSNNTSVEHFVTAKNVVSTAMQSSKGPNQMAPEPKIKLQHIARSKRELRPTMPFDFHTLHAPCEHILSKTYKIVELMPNHCIWVYNNRYAHEGFYRVFKLYQLESFFFYQYYDRLLRLEMVKLLFYPGPDYVVGSY